MDEPGAEEEEEVHVILHEDAARMAGGFRRAPLELLMRPQGEDYEGESTDDDETNFQIDDSEEEAPQRVSSPSTSSQRVGAQLPHLHHDLSGYEAVVLASRAASPSANHVLPLNIHHLHSILPRNMQALNEDGSLTPYGESLIASYSGSHVNSAVRNINALNDQAQSPAQRGVGDVAGNEEGTVDQGYVDAAESTDSTSRAGESSSSSSADLTGESRGMETERRVPHCAAANAPPANDVIAIGRRPSPSERQLRKESRSAALAAVNLDPRLGWQAAKSTLRDRIAFLHCNDILADVYFIVGKEDEKQRIPAHKFVLSIGSVVFDAMFNGGLSPSGDCATSDALEIELPDVEPSAFLTLLKFLYSDEVQIGPESVMTTLYTAKKYAVPAMETACVDFLKMSLGADNAFMLLSQARLFDEPQLAQLCLEKIDKDSLDALGADGFAEIDLSTLCAVLSRDTLRVRELPLFHAVCRWAEAACERRGQSSPAQPEQLRAALGNAIFLICFPLMTPEEFANGPAQSGLLTDAECKSIFISFHSNPGPSPVSSPFSARPRCAIDGPEMVIHRFQRVDARWGYNGLPDRIKFTVDRKIYLTGFGLHGSVNGPYEYKVAIQIIHCGTGKVLAQNDTSFVCDGSTEKFKVSFREPVEIVSNVTYIASACIKGGDSHYGTKGLRRVVHPSGSPTFQFTYAAGNNNGTSVEDGQIPEIYFYCKDD